MTAPDQDKGPSAGAVPALNRGLLRTLGLSYASADIVMEELERLWAKEQAAQPLAAAMEAFIRSASTAPQMDGSVSPHGWDQKKLNAAFQQALDALRGWESGGGT